MGLRAHTLNTIVELFYTDSIVTPLSTSYVGDSDVVMKGVDLFSEEGVSLYRENYLLSAVETRVNNYNALYLCNNTRNNDLMELKTSTSTANVLFATSLRFSNIKKFLRISNNFASVEFVDENDDHGVFELELIDDTTATIAYQTNVVDAARTGLDRYYLLYNGTVFYFARRGDAGFSTNNTRFNYLVDSNSLYLFVGVNKSSVTATTTSLTAVDNALWKQNYIEINYYLQTLQMDFDTSWVAYAANDRNSMIVNPEKSVGHLPSNSVFYSNYTYISGNDIKTNFITLKNQHTHKNFSYRADNTTKADFNAPNVNMREYRGMHTGVEQEQGAESITLLYEFQNVDYKVKADQYTVFRTPESLYPYTQINVNDTLFSRQGSIGGDTPYTADKIFFNDTRAGKSDGQYLCTWLSAASPTGEGIWMDRYYLPERASYLAALTSKSFFSYKDPVTELLNAPLPVSSYYDAPMVYADVQQEYEHTPQTIKDVLYGEYFFDKASDLVFVPNQDYIYQRMGNKYIATIIESLSDNLIQNGLSAKTSKGVDIAFTEAVDDVEYNFDNNTYAIVENYKKINNTNEFTASFWLNADDWSSKFGHEVLGSFNDSGFGVFNDQMVTPIITVQDGRKVVYLNTDFLQIDAAYLSQKELNESVDDKNVINGNYTTNTKVVTSFYIKDMVRGDHLDINMPIITHNIATTTTTSITPVIYTNDECGLLLFEDDAANVYTPLEPDHVIDNNLQTLTGIESEPCKFSTDKTIL